MAATQDGKTLFLKIVQHGDKRGWVTRQLIEYFGSSPYKISDAAKRAGIGGYRLSDTHLDPLKDANIIDINTTHMKFYSEEEVARLALHLRSKTAEDMVIYGFGVGVRAARGEPVTVDLGLSPIELAKRTHATASETHYEEHEAIAGEFVLGVRFIVLWIRIGGVSSKLSRPQSAGSRRSTSRILRITLS